MSGINVQELLNKIDAARILFEEAKRRTSIARNEECTALNRLNVLQKEFDDVVLGLRKTAPRESDWKSSHISKAAE